LPYGLKFLHRCNAVGFPANIQHDGVWACLPAYACFRHESMAEFLSWIQDNWAEVVTAIGIIVGVFFTVASFCQKIKKENKDEEYALLQEHKELWRGANERTELKRVFDSQVDLNACPITASELVFLNEVFIHFERGWKAAKQNTFLKMETYVADVRWFLAHPFPRAVWEKTKQSRNPEFVRFVEQTVERSRRDNL